MDRFLNPCFCRLSMKRYFGWLFICVTFLPRSLNTLFLLLLWVIDNCWVFRKFAILIIFLFFGEIYPTTCLICITTIQHILWLRLLVPSWVALDFNYVLACFLGFPITYYGQLMQIRLLNQSLVMLHETFPRIFVWIIFSLLSRTNFGKFVTAYLLRWTTLNWVLLRLDTK